MYVAFVSIQSAEQNNEELTNNACLTRSWNNIGGII